ncbi:uncharacterized protein LOC129590598 isoform X6 [Paramacrobiotus metropolitanus]|uniref:uncharacterized protein LOC129590598 isoform X6 n=1 Tax=Paramacrobiotus metropolitanus TaxID=2943436 RepID=UPI002445ABF0|nr:uncharacterized protein LOC129590598 isoform X6 [Paramacrobiotus metropolitanus]
MDSVADKHHQFPKCGKHCCFRLCGEYLCLEQCPAFCSRYSKGHKRYYDLPWPLCHSGVMLTSAFRDVRGRSHFLGRVAMGAGKGYVKETIVQELNATVGYYDYVSTYLLPKSDDLLIVDAMNNSDGKFVHATLFGCCGVTNGYCDFMSAPYSRNSPYGLIAPVFCCKMYDPKLLQLASGGKCSDIAFRHSEYVSNYRVGCKSEIDNFVDYNASAIMGVTMGTAIVELLTALFAVILCRQGKTDYD